MSRIGKKPIPVPSGVTVAINGAISVEGPKGKLSVPMPKGIQVERKDAQLVVTRESDGYAANHGLARALIANAVNGVSQGFSKVLEIVGIGYRVELVGRVLVFNLGYSHQIEVLLPAGVDAKVEKQTILTLTSHDRQQLGQIAAQIRMLRKPDVYKNKGVRYQGERLQKKEGKAGGR